MIRGFNWTVFSFILLLALIACQKENSNSSNNVLILGHAGSGLYSIFNPYPPNSEISIKHALFELGADGVEIDVQIDKDGILWIFHDNLLEPESNCFGCIGNTSTLELESCIYSNLSFPNENLYKVYDLIQSLSSLEKKPFVLIDVKIYEGCYDPLKMRASITSLIDDFDAKSWVNIGSTSLNLIEAIETQDSTYHTYYEVSDPQYIFENNNEKNFDGVLSKNEQIDKQTVLDFQNEGFKLILFDAEGSTNMKKLKLKHPDYLISDDIMTARSILMN